MEILHYLLDVKLKPSKTLITISMIFYTLCPHDP